MEFAGLVCRQGSFTSFPPSPQKTEYDILEQLQSHACAAGAFTDGEALSVASVLQFVIAGVKTERLHDIGARPQELPVQLTHWDQLKIKKNQEVQF